jgi:hypothetical protein
MRALRALGLALPLCAAAQPLPIFDAHLHYSHDAWELVPVEQALELLRMKKYPNLWCDLAVRADHAAGGAGHADWSRQWLADLPPEVAERIAWKNGERIFGSLLQPH